MSTENHATVWPGGPMLAATIVAYLAGAALLSRGADWESAIGGLVLALAVLSSLGFFTLQPNEARVLILFGRYQGTTRQVGFLWGNPFFSNGSSGGRRGRALGGRDPGAAQASRRLPRYKISLRARTLNGERLKVNDRAGNPIDIAAVVVWHVEDTAQAIFDVDDFEAYVGLQSETALRHLASAYAYDRSDDAMTEEVTLRGNVDQVSAALEAELLQRLAKAGVAVDEARLTHLAYAPEIAQTMLRRQQAEAVIAARRKIVHGAVGMVDQALQVLSERQVVELDEERKAAMVSNLLVVLCGESQVSPIVNAGTLYQ
jgi:regulator of protease activity HflC (stomatin/prohibitin superfamily)